MLESRSELVAMEQLIDASKKKVSALHGGYYPSLDLVGSYTNYEDSYLNGYGDISEDELRAQISLSLNLFDGFSDEAEIAAAKAETRSLVYDLAELQEDMKTGLKNLFVDYEISLANVAVAKEDITYAEESLKITELKYKEGLQRQLDLLDAVANLTRAQSNYVAVIRTVFENFFQIIRMVEDFPALPKTTAATEEQ
jgi:outer membrane protein TolC